MWGHGKTPPIKDGTGRVKAGSIAELKQMRLGGLDQWVLIRGHSVTNPLLLYLHGGPGGSDFGALRRWNRVLEERFTVVHWVQRGAGKSYSRRIPPESMTPDQLVSDAVELIHRLRERFGQSKVYVVGQSVGTLIGLLLAHRHPELIQAYVGVNQIVNRVEEELISYQFVLDYALELAHDRALSQLERHGPPVDAGAADIDGIVVQRNWLRRFGQVTHDPRRANQWMLATLFAPEHTWRDRLLFMRGLGFSMKLLWPQLATFDAPAQIPVLQVPVYLVAGRHDHITSLPLTERYFAQLAAPHKELHIFERSGHIALFEEPDRFNALMIDRVLTVAPAPVPVPQPASDLRPPVSPAGWPHVS